MRAQAQAQPNIALVKYWGKRDAERNLPAVGSLSLTLESLWTRMDVDFGSGGSRDRLTVNGADAEGLLPRVTRCLDRVAGPGRPSATVVSDSNFPIAAGLASSASSFAALTVAAAAAAGHNSDRLTLARLAGNASGSAARSLYGGIVELAAGDDDVDLQQLASPTDWPLEVVVAVTSAQAKPVSSGAAMMRSAETSPFYARWVNDQQEDLDAARDAVNGRSLASLAAVSEANCLKMHSVMWTSRPPIVYWNETTLSCMQGVRELREDGVDVFFTIDAGPQVKAICQPQDADRVARRLEVVGGVIEVLRSGLGPGARLLES